MLAQPARDYPLLSLRNQKKRSDSKKPLANTTLLANAGTFATREQNVNPWSVTGEVDEDGNVKPINYNKLVEQFGTKLIDEALLERFERVTGHKTSPIPSTADCLLTS